VSRLAKFHFHHFMLWIRIHSTIVGSYCQLRLLPTKAASSSDGSPVASSGASLAVFTAATGSTSDGSLEALFDNNGISRRERDALAFLLAGITNQENAD
jgi:hypothetical protein